MHAKDCDVALHYDRVAGSKMRAKGFKSEVPQLIRMDFKMDFKLGF